jgi:hypothetical protein
VRRHDETSGNLIGDRGSVVTPDDVKTEIDAGALPAVKFAPSMRTSGSLRRGNVGQPIGLHNAL